MNGVQTRFKCKLDVKRCKRFVFPPSSLLPRSNALKTKAIRYFQTDRTLTRIVSPPLEGANFWLSVLTDLKARGMKDVLIACIDNLTGFAEAISTIFPEVIIQNCVIHQIRNSLKYIASKDQKEFMADLKTVYQAPNKDLAELNLDKLQDKWGKKYPVVLESWRRNWDNLSAYFAYDEHIRRLIYTTNAVEGFHRQVRKVTKTKGVFPNDMALMKLIYLAVMNISKKWTQPLQNWALTAGQLRIKFGERMPLAI